MHRAYRQAYGAEKTWRALNASGVACGKHRVARLCRQACIEALRKQWLRRLEKNSLLGPTPNCLKRRFTVHCPMRRHNNISHPRHFTMETMLRLRLNNANCASPCALNFLRQY
ncbi:IS3 family transposase [Achromobacter spanius]|uniref:IS3 family transposase n=1 Tax=Achromobacter spanius TaxID=217203 RepID=UPI003F692188